MQITVIMKLYPAAMGEPITAEEPWKHMQAWEIMHEMKIRFALLHERYRGRFK